MQDKLFVSGVIFVIVYLMIAFEKVIKVPRTASALIGASAMMLSGVLDQNASMDHGEILKGAVDYIDFNILGLLLGMMIIVDVTKRTGVFAYVATLSAKVSKGNPVVILILLSWVTAILSAFLDNVTTVIIIAPVTLLIANELEISPLPLLLAQVIFSNIGGTATLIGDPPNILIGSKANLSFTDFIVTLSPVVIVVMIISSVGFWILYRKTLKAEQYLMQKIQKMEPKMFLKDKRLLIICLSVIAAVIVMFLFHEKLRLQAGTIAISGAVVLLFLSRVKLEEILVSIDWSTLLFFAGLFIIIGGLESAGWISMVSEGITSRFGGNLLLLTIVILWFSAIASAIVDNIPFTATMIPVIIGIARGLHPEISNYAQLVHHPDVIPLWWALALGACFGGNATLIGASANIIVAGISEKTRAPINFANFLKVGIPFTLISLLASTAFLVLRFFTK